MKTDHFNGRLTFQTTENEYRAVDFVIPHNPRATTLNSKQIDEFIEDFKLLVAKHFTKQR